MSIRQFFAFLSLCLLALAVDWPIIFAQTETTQINNQLNDVVIDGRRVLTIRAGLKTVTPEMRARALEERILRYASDPYFNTASITVEETDISSDIVAGDNILMSVFDVDGKAEGRSRQELAAQYVQPLRAAIDQYRIDHSRRHIMKGALFALLSTLGLLLVLFIIQRLWRKIESELPVWAYSKMIPDRVKKYHLIEPDQFNSLILLGVKFIRSVVTLILLYLYIGLVFSFFPWTQGLAGKLLDLAAGPLKTLWQGMRKQVPNLFFIFILVLITKYLLKLMKAFFHGIERGTIE